MNSLTLGCRVRDSSDVTPVTMLIVSALYPFSPLYIYLYLTFPTSILKKSDNKV